MFYIKVMNKFDSDYQMFSANRYRVSRTYTDNEVAGKQQHVKALIILDEHLGENQTYAIEVESTAYIMGDNGKTIDTIYTN